MKIQLLLSSLVFAFFMLNPAEKIYPSETEKNRSLTDQEKIEYLIGCVGKLDNARFYRNGTWYDAKSAADHLRMKLSKAGYSVKTVDDFIIKIASRSYITGVPYKIRFNDGSEMDMEVYMKERLKGLDN